MRKLACFREIVRKSEDLRVEIRLIPAACKSSIAQNGVRPALS